MNRIFTFLLLLTLGNSAIAQDIHFTQYYAAPITLSPAMTGILPGNFRLVGNYKTQWGSVSDGPYVTYAGSFDVRVDKGFVPYDNFGLGIHFFNDRAGDGQLSDLNFLLTGSYIKVLNRFRDKFFSIGTHVGFNSRSINYTRLRWGSQWNGSSADPNISSGEAFDLNSGQNLELGAGLMWYMLKKNRKSVNFGIAAHHINQPNVSFSSKETVRMDMRLTGHAGAIFPINTKTDFLPSLLVMRQGKFTEINPGIGLKIHLDKTTSLGFNIWDRLGRQYEGKMFNDAINIGARVDYNNVGLGLSYDLNFSDLDRGSNNRGSFELSVVYTDKAKSKHKTLNCPRF